jgi:hypothetical protein
VYLPEVEGQVSHPPSGVHVKIRFRRSIRLWPFTWHFTQSGYSSFSVKLGPWSYNSRRDRHRVDLPGGFHLG